MREQNNVGSINFFMRDGLSTCLYELFCDLEKLSNIQKEIDNYYGKGDLHTVQAFQLESGLDYNHHLEIISTKYLGKRSAYYSCGCYSSSDNFYEYKYYDYELSFLSQVIEKIINSIKYKNEMYRYYVRPLDLSYVMDKLLNYGPSIPEESEFYKKIFDCLKFTRQARVNLFSHCKDTTEFNHSFDKSIEYKIMSDEIYASIVLERKRGKKNDDFHFLPPKRLLLKFDYFKTLPKSKLIDE